MRFVVLIIVCIGAWHQPVVAQRRPPVLGSEGVASAAAMHVRAPVLPLVRWGILGGAVGVIAGSIAIGLPLAYALEPTDDDLSTPGIIIGLQLGQALGIPTGVHLARGRRGKYGRALLLSAAAAAIGTALLWTDDFDAVFEDRRNQVVLIAVPIVQLITSIHVARSSDARSTPP